MRNERSAGYSGIPKRETLCACGTYFSAKAVANPSDLRDPQSLAQVSNDLRDDGIHGIRRVSLEPGGDIYILVIEIIGGQGVAVEQIRDDGEQAARGEVVGDQLDVLVDTEDVAEDDDCLFGRVAGGTGEVDVNCWFVGIGSLCVGGLEWEMRCDR